MKRFKVFKKLCSLALILSMLVSMIPMNVFATTTEENPEEQPQKTPIIVDTPKTGSLIINKYDGDDTSTPLNEVTFNAYKIMDINVEKKINADNGDVSYVFSYEILDDYEPFFGSDKIGINSGAELVEKDAAVVSGYITELKEFITKHKINYTATATTGKSKNEAGETVDGEIGKAVMENLTLGYYLVVETGYPSHIGTAIAPFFVSIPMTSQDGDEWIYDVKVHPKNQSAYGSVKINKTGNNGVALSGVTFELQKQKWDNFNNPVKDDTGNLIWEDIKYKDSLGNDKAMVTENGELTFTGLTRGVYRVKETSIGNNEEYILDDSAYYEFEVVWKDGELQYKYNNETKESLIIDVTNEKPEINKEVTSYIGKDVNWTITTTVPSTIEKLKTYKIIDTLSEGLTFDLDTAGVVVTKNGTPLNVSDYTLTETKNSNQQQVLTFNFTKDVLTGGEEIVIQYQTRLNENAVIVGEGNPNNVELVYSKSTTTDSTTDNWKDEDTSKVYAGGVNIFKHDGNNSPLGGAEFQIYGTKADALAQTNPIKVLVSGELVTTVTSGTDGIVSFTGLAYGTLPTDSRKYWVVETKAPEDFNLLKEPFEVTVNATSHTLTAASADITKVLNKKGFTLPETGGMGTVIFTVAGLGIMGLAGSAYIALKRKESQQ